MAKRNHLFSAGERRVAGIALLSAVVLTLSLMVLETALRPSLGLYDAAGSTLHMPNVIDAQPMSRVAAF